MLLSKKTSRRDFMVGCSAAIAAMAGSQISYTAFASAEASHNDNIIVVVFLRGGCDALNLVVPRSGVDRGRYENERQNLIIPSDELLTLGTLTGHAGADNVELGLHPMAAPLYDLYQNQSLAIVPASGLDYGSRSHFDMMEFMELGTPGNKGTTDGWLTRHLQSSPSLPDEIVTPAMAIGNAQPTSLLASREAIVANDLSDFTLNTGQWRWRDSQRQALRKLYSGSTWLHDAGIQTLDAADIIESQDLSYTPANGADYPNNGFGDDLQSIAQIIKLQLGLRVATIDLGGWDTHEYQGDDSGGYFGSAIERLAQGLSAFYTDLDGSGDQNYNNKVTVVVMTEFGRKLIMNASRGTDHGHGSFMFVMGGDQVNGGQLFGSWPGLSSDQLFDGRDLGITTDYRCVLSEILVRHMGNPNLGFIFPGYADYEPKGLINGHTGLIPIYDEAPNRVFIPLVTR